MISQKYPSQSFFKGRTDTFFSKIRVFLLGMNVWVVKPLCSGIRICAKSEKKRIHFVWNSVLTSETVSAFVYKSNIADTMRIKHWCDTHAVSEETDSR